MERIKYIRGVEGRGEEIKDLFKNMGVEKDALPVNLEHPKLLYFVEAGNWIRAYHKDSQDGKELQAIGEEMFLD